MKEMEDIKKMMENLSDTPVEEKQATIADAIESAKKFVSEKLNATPMDTCAETPEVSDKIKVSPELAEKFKDAPTHSMEELEGNAISSFDNTLEEFLKVYKKSLMSNKEFIQYNGIPEVAVSKLRDEFLMFKDNSVRGNRYDFLNIIEEVMRNQIQTMRSNIATTHDDYHPGMMIYKEMCDELAPEEDQETDDIDAKLKDIYKKPAGDGKTAESMDIDEDEFGIIPSDEDNNHCPIEEGINDINELMAELFESVNTIKEKLSNASYVCEISNYEIKRKDRKALEEKISKTVTKEMKHHCRDIIESIGRLSANIETKGSILNMSDRVLDEHITSYYNSLSDMLVGITENINAMNMHLSKEIDALNKKLDTMMEKNENRMIVADEKLYAVVADLSSKVNTVLDRLSPPEIAACECECEAPTIYQQILKNGELYLTKAWFEDKLKRGEELTDKEMEVFGKLIKDEPTKRSPIDDVLDEQ